MSIADGIVGAVKYGHRRKTLLSVAALIAVLVVAAAYLFLGALRRNPLASEYNAIVELPSSGGLLANQNVTLRGVRVGWVDRLEIVPTGINAHVKIDSKTKISESTGVRVTGLSAAGEQYVDFDGGNGEAPFMKDGSRFKLGQATVPVTLAQLLAHGDGTLKQVDPEKLEILKEEMSISKDGPQKLTDLVDGGTFLLGTMDSVLPETTTLFTKSKTLLELLADKNAGIAVANENFSSAFAGINRMSEGFRELTVQAPKGLHAADNLFVDNSDTMDVLLGNMVPLSNLLYQRVPALNALFPNYRGSMLDALGTVMHDNGFWATGDIYPRYSCDYGTPRHPPSSADYPEPFMYTYCRDDDPAVLVRGAKNAPRPAGDDTAGPPLGADLGKRTDPTPKGRFTIPTPYGGPTLPIEPPK
jgi:virulence factor Mce-like protein